jgi:hypothetical protein
VTMAGIAMAMRKRRPRPPDYPRRRLSAVSNRRTGENREAAATRRSIAAAASQTHAQKPPRFPSAAVPLRWVCLEMCRAERCSDRSPSLLGHRTHSRHRMRLSTRCRRVGANVSPIQGMMSLALMLIKPALLS